MANQMVFLKGGRFRGPNLLIRSPPSKTKISPVEDQLEV